MPKGGAEVVIVNDGLDPIPDLVLSHAVMVEGRSAAGVEKDGVNDVQK